MRLLCMPERARYPKYLRNAPRPRWRRKFHPSASSLPPPVSMRLVAHAAPSPLSPTSRVACLLSRPTCQPKLRTSPSRCRSLLPQSRLQPLPLPLQMSLLRNCSCRSAAAHTLGPGPGLPTRWGLIRGLLSLRQMNRTCVTSVFSPCPQPLPATSRALSIAISDRCVTADRRGGG